MVPILAIWLFNTIERKKFPKESQTIRYCGFRKHITNLVPGTAGLRLDNENKHKGWSDAGRKMREFLCLTGNSQRSIIRRVRCAL